MDMTHGQYFLYLEKKITQLLFTCWMNRIDDTL